MAATGGGKIRTRRYHIASKPYAKGKQQPGLISRVTDTVKSIVPSWLQKYFKNGEIDEGREARVEVEQNNVPPSNGSDEPVPLRDGRNSPEPSTSNAEPSTSKASLNFHDILSRPPLNRSHLHFPSHDASPALGGSSLFSQPSTSTAPFTGSPFAVASSFSLVKEIKDSSSQHEDDNISTTSGFSSRASDKDVPTSKTAPLLWSPETERTHSGLQSTHATLKKPAFNLSVFGNSSTSAVNSSVLNSSQLGDSPFYPGKTTYGGAAAARTARGRPGTPYQHPVRRQIKAKPAGAQPCGVTSATARRILQSLERMSSPLADAKRIPSLSSPLTTPLNQSSEDVSHMPAKKKNLDPAFPPVQKLLIPAAASVSGNRSMSFRPSLTPGSVSRTVEKSKNETPVRCPSPSPRIPDATPAPLASTSSLSYPLSSTPAASSAGGGGKMKRERSSRISSKRPNDDVAEVPDLPAISLPITTFPQITFSFSSPLPISTSAPSTTSVTSAPAETTVSKEDPTVSAPFTFSLPIFKASNGAPPSIPATSGFTFSAPAMMTAHSVSKKRPVPAERELKEASESQGHFEGPFKPAKTLKQGSVLDILKGPGFASPAQSPPVSENNLQMASTGLSSISTPVSGFGGKFKPAAGSWNCDSCLLQNKASDKVCVACNALKPNSDSSSKSDSKPAKAPAANLSSLFTPPPGSWDCDTCLVRNKPDVVKCVACETAKPGTGVKPAITLPPVSETASTLCTSTVSSATTTTPTSNTSTLPSFGELFKKAAGSWDCDVCMVQNKAQDPKCVACQTPKPGAAAAAPSLQAPASTPATSAPLLGFGDKFKKPEGSWDCDTCCVSNKAEDQQCVACQTAKPGAKAESKGNLPSTAGSNSFGFKFGTNSLNSASGGLKFGGALSNSSFQFKDSSDSTSTSGGFKFGTSNSNSSVSFGFGENTKTETASAGTSSTGGLKFELASTTSASEDKKSEPQNPGTGFKFGFSSGIGSSTGDASTATTTASGGFTFGVSKPEEKEGSVSTFSFSTPKTEKTEAPSSTAAVLTMAPAAPITVPVFGKPPVSESALPAPSSTAVDETAAKKPAPTISTFTFGKPEEKVNTTVQQGGFVFSAAKQKDTHAPSLSFTFSEEEAPKEVPKPAFTLGKPAEAAETPKPAFTFGQNTDNSAPKLSFGFMANSPSAPATSAPAPSLFGAPSSSTLAPTTAPSSTFTFGQAASSNATPTKPFVFGQQDSQPAPTVPPAAAPATVQPFGFGSASNSTTHNFFGTAANAAPASAAPAPSTTPSPFVFNSASSVSGSGSGFGSSQTPVFGQGASQAAAPMFGSPAPSFSATASPAPTFGTKPNAAPVFGQQPSSTPFGSSTGSAGQGGFQFGGSSGFGSSANNSGVFTFGTVSGSATRPAPPPTMSTQPAAPGGSFNFSQPPAFNIGSSKSSFSPATPGQHSIAGRKIKTAVRRRK